MTTYAEYLAKRQKEEQDRAAAAAGIVVGSTERSPDEVAGDMRLARDYARETGGMEPPLPMVAENRPLFQQKVDEVRTQKLLSGNPALAEWLRDPANAAIAKDSIEELSWFEQDAAKPWRMPKPEKLPEDAGFFDRLGAALGPGVAMQGEMFQNEVAAAEAIGRGVKRGAVTATAVPPAFEGMFNAEMARDVGKTQEQIYEEIVGTLGPNAKNETMLADARRKAQLRFDAVSGLSPEQQANLVETSRAAFAEARSIIDRVRSIPMSDAAMRFRDQGLAGAENSVGGFFSAVGADPAGAVAFVLETAAESIPLLGASTAATFVGGPGVGAGVMGGGSFALENTLEVDNFLREKGLDLTSPETASEVLMNPDIMREAKDRGLTRGLIVGLLDTISGGVAGQTLAKSPVGNMLLQMLTQAAFGAGGEALAQAANGDELQWADILVEGLAELATAPIEVMGVGGQMFSDSAAKADRARQTQESIQGFVDMAVKSKVRERAPDAFRDYIARTTAGKDAETMYVPADAFDEYFQSSGLNPDEIIAQLDGVDPNQVMEARATGGDIAIPTATFAAKIAGSEHDKFLLQNSRFDPEDMTFAEAETWETEKAALLEQAMQQAETIREQAAVEVEAGQQIFDTMVQRITAAGWDAQKAKNEALLYRKFYETRAARSGQTVASLLERYPLPEMRGAAQQPQETAVAETAPDAGLYDQAGQARTDSEPFKQWFGKSAVVDDSGAPLVVYHGTTEDFSEFRQGPMGFGIYFTPDPDIARIYATGTMQEGSPEETMEITGGPEGAKTIPVYLRMENPLVITASEYLMGQTEDGTLLADQERLIRSGWDGIRVKGDPEMGDDLFAQDNYIVFDPTQIKSVFNRGTFDRSSPNILEQPGVPLFDEPLQIEGKTTVRAIGEAMTEDHMQKHGRKLFPESSEEDYQSVLGWMADEVATQLKHPNSGLGWYSKDVQLSMELASRVYPTLATNPTHRDLFLTFAGLFSNGAEPEGAFMMSAEAFEAFLATGTIPTTRSEAFTARGLEPKTSTFKNPRTGEEVTQPTGFGVRNAANEQQLQFVKHIVEREGGIEQGVAWLRSKHPRAEINRAMTETGLYKQGRYVTKKEIAGEDAYGIMAFGEKLGRYTMGLHGVEVDAGDTTIDLWYTRTYRRLTGRLLDSPVGNEGVVGGPTDQDRKAIFRLTGDLVKQFDLPAGDVQAVLWFWEKRLWAAQGLRTNEGTNSSGAKKLLRSKGIDDGTGSDAASDGAGDQAQGREYAQTGYGDRAARYSSGGLTPLAGAPTVEGASGPDPRLVAVAEQYARENGIDLKRQATFVEVDEERAARIAAAYEAMEHAPSDPRVQEAYANLIDQTMAQYRALEAAGYQFWFIDPDADPYAGNPWNAMRDLRANQRMAVFPTEAGFGSGDTDIDVSDNPLMADTGIEWSFGTADGPKKRVLANDLFRAVHDAFGHGLEGAGFRARGEENAWQAHVRLFTGSAVAAITSETRGQNSWLNYGPHGETNRTAKVEDTVFADQKTGLLPEWVWLEGRALDEQPTVDERGMRYIPDRPQLPIRADGKVELTHWSNSRRKEINPEKAGTGPLTGPDYRSGAELSFYGIDAASSREAQKNPNGYVKEAGLGPWRHTVAVDPARLYPWFEDPMGLKEKFREQEGMRASVSDYQEMIREAGYLGYYTTEDGTGSAVHGLAAAVFEPLKPERVVDERKIAPPSAGKSYAQSAKPSVVQYDNPGGQWLREKQEDAEAAMEKYKGNVLRSSFAKGLKGATTAYAGPVMLPTELLAGLPGASGENRRPGDPKFDELNALVERYGFQADQSGSDGGSNAVLVGVNHKGEAYLIEGNTRTAVAASRGIPMIRAEVRWLNGGETAGGPITPEIVEAAAQPDAPRGRSYNQTLMTPPTEEITETEAFKKWFGESKVVDNTGKPKVVFHGSEKAGFVVFDTSGRGKTDGTGAFFTDEVRNAMTYSGTQRNYEFPTREKVMDRPTDYGFDIETNDDGVFLSGPDGEWVQVQEGETPEEVMGRLVDEWIANGFDYLDQARGNYSVYLKIENPYVYDAQGKNWSELGGETIYQIWDENEDTVEYFYDKEEAEQYLADNPDENYTINVEEIPGDETTDTIVRQVRDGDFGEYDGVIFENIADEGPHGHGYGIESTVYVVFKPNQIKSVQNRGNFDTKSNSILEQRNRGSIQFPAGGIGNGQTVINTFKDADLSTILHESGHLFLTILQAEAMRGEPSAAKEFDDLKSWWLSNAADVAKDASRSGRVEVSAEDVERAVVFGSSGDVAKDNAIDVGMQEQFARGFEAYLMTGEAPSLELRSIFTAFREWLKSVYQSLTSLKVNVTPEAKAVFDRMLATDEEIAKARQREGEMGPLFASAADMGLEPDDFEKYRKLAQEAQDEATAKLTAEVMGPIRRQKEQWWRAEKAKLVEKLTAEKQSLPIYRAIQEMRFGRTFEGDPTPNIKLNRKVIEQRHGENVLALLPGAPKTGKGHRYAVYATGEGGMHPDVIAEMYGFKTGRELIGALLNTPALEQAVETEAEALMVQRHGDILKDGSIEQAAMDALKTDKKALLIARELGALNARLQADPKLKRSLLYPKVSHFREMARRTLERMPVNDARATSRYVAASRKAAEEAMKALAKGDLRTAADAKRRHLLAHMMYMEARKIDAEVDKLVNRIGKLNRADSSQAKGVNVDYVKAARAVASKFGLASPDAAFDFDMWLEQLAQDDPATHAALGHAIQTYTQNAKPFKALTVGEFRAVADAVANLVSLGRTARKVEIEGETISRDEVISDLSAVLEQRGISANPALKAKLKASQRMGKAALSMLSALRRVEAWARDMDDGQQGVYTRYLVRPVMDAIGVYRDAKAQRLEQLLAILKPLRKDALGSGAISAPELDYTFENKAEVLHAILHTGNESNKEKLLIGRGWSPGMTNQKQKVTPTGKLSVDRKGNPIMDRGTVDTSRWDTFIARMISEGTLTKADYDAVQAIWDLMEELKRPAQAAHRKMFGFYFQEIEASPVSTPFGVYRGGYVPAIADQDASNDGQIRADQSALEAQQTSFMFPTTGSGFTKSRVQQYRTPLALDLMLLPAHMDKVLRFTHLEPVIRQTAGIITARPMREAMDAYDQSLIPSMLTPWLQRTAQQAVEARATTPAGRAFSSIARELRRRVGIHTMFMNLVNTAQQVTGFSTAMILVKPGRMSAALARYIMGGAPSMRAEAMAQSAFMRERVGNAVRETQSRIQEAVVKPTIPSELRALIDKHGYVLQQMTQNVMDVIIWHAAYDQAIAKGMTDDEAVFEADSVIRRTIGDFSPENLSLFETGNAFTRLFTMFYSYFNGQANLVGGEMQTAMRTLGWNGAPRMFWVYLMGVAVPAIVAELIVQGFRGDLGDDEDDGYADEIAAITLGSQARYIAAMIPVAGQVSMALVNRFNDQVYDDRLSTSPVVSTVERAAGAPASIADAVFSDGSPKRAVQDGLTALGLITGIPMGQLSKMAGYGIDVQTGEANPQGVGDVIQGLASGKDGTAQ